MAIEQGKTNLLRITEQVFAVAGILHMLGALQIFFNNSTYIGSNRINAAMVTDGTLGMQVIGAGIYLIAFVLLLSRSKDIVTLLGENKALALFIGLILVSALWSELPAVTLRRSIALTGTTIFGFYLALRFRARELLNMLALAFGLIAVENLLAVLLVPNIAIHRYSNAGAWAGALGHKNIMGRTMVLGMLVLWTAAPQLRRYKALVWSAFSLCLFLVAMSQSRTSWIAGTALILAIPFLRYMRRSHIPMIARVLLVATVGLGGIGFLVSQYEDVGLQLLGRDATFTGRTDIWAASIAIGMDKPLLGSGYRTFYTSGLTNSLRIGNGHNSFLDIWLELGTIGFGAFTATFLVAGRRALRRLASSTDRTGFFYVLFLASMVLFGMAAQVFPDHGTIAWVIYIVTILYLTPFSIETRPSRATVPRQSTAPATSPLPAE